MKRTSVIILTLVASLSISLSSAESNPGATVYPPDFLYESDFAEGDTIKYDTLRHDSTRYYYQPQVTYNYYYRSRFWNSLFRICRPRRYYSVISQPGYVPRHIRSDRRALAPGSSSSNSPGHRPSRGSTSGRGGFGHSGSSHPQSN